MFASLGAEKFPTDSYKLNISVFSGELLFCALIFHDPVYMLALRITDQLAELYCDALSSQPRFAKDLGISSSLSTSAATCNQIAASCCPDSFSQPCKHYMRVHARDLKHSCIILALDLKREQAQSTCHALRAFFERSSPPSEILTDYRLDVCICVCLFALLLLFKKN